MIGVSLRKQIIFQIIETSVQFPIVQNVSSSFNVKTKFSCSVDCIDFIVDVIYIDVKAIVELIKKDKTL